MDNLFYKSFRDTDLSDPFFDTLKQDYQGFDKWFEKKAKADDYAYVLYDTNNYVEGFLYVKTENGIVDDVEPPLPHGHHLKIGTFKFNSAGTRRGERFIKKIFDIAYERNVDDIYVTIFSKHDYLIRIFEKYGFIAVSNKNHTDGRAELVYYKQLRRDYGDILLNYPLIVARDVKKYLISIYPSFHSRMLPDSILNNEHHDIIQDVSHTNSIHKIYLCAMEGTTQLKRGDILLTYRTSDEKGRAYYRSVVTSVCIVEEYKNIGEFRTLADFLKYTLSYSVFSEAELTKFFREKKYPHIIKFTYNTALKRRVNRKSLLEDVGMPSSDQVYWGFMELSDTYFNSILELGEVNESLIID